MADIFKSLIRANDRVISIVGGGGKTSLMFQLAHAFQQKGVKVISTTTTRILRPTPQQTSGVVLYDQDNFNDQLQKCLNRHGHATVAQRLLPTGDKLEGISCSQVEELLDHSPAQRIVIEADGARQLSFKAPGDNEPVVPKITDVFISVVGLDIIGKALTDDNVFRAELVSERTGLNMGDEITPRAIARLALHPEGLLKGCPENARSYILLNKTDIPGGREEALSVITAAKYCEGKKPDCWIGASIRKDLCESY
ncbi:MAG TPA: putative selenium-dependent hydroxylase accessory protein YqeC [Desulfocapsa sulfexigens]|nr:putative selenium-dependent hydroxylase accessory protein YqeC [Desulfocapsa sulfexigens]